MHYGKLFYFCLIVFPAFALLSACSDPPKDELTLARQAIDAVVSEGAEIYTPEDLGRITAKLKEAETEIRHQDELFFRNYGLATFTLGQVVADADALQAKLAQRKKDLNTAAETAFQNAQAAVGQLRWLLEVAFPGEGGSPAAVAVRNDFANLESALGQIQTDIDAGEFSRAGELAQVVTDRALDMSILIRRDRNDLARTGR